jgi:hypothetical protein
MPGATISGSDLAQNEMPGTFTTQKTILDGSKKYYFRYKLYLQEFSEVSKQKACDRREDDFQKPKFLWRKPKTDS